MIFAFKKQEKKVEEKKCEMTEVVLNNFCFEITGDPKPKIFIRNKKTNKVAVLNSGGLSVYAASELSSLINCEVDDDFVKILALDFFSKLLN